MFTELGLKERGRCCGSGCRHCPFAHENVPTEHRGELIQQASWLHPLDDETGERPIDLLFWSGGKDSLLTLRALQRDSPNRPVLVTTFDAHRRRVAHQELELEAVIRQARHLELPLLGIPLHPGRDYHEAVEPALERVPRLARLVFGDLHLEHIRGWREQAFGPFAEAHGVSLAFPIWHADYGTLLADLEASGVPCEVSAVTAQAAGFVEVGDRFDRSLVESLPDTIDAFGENGEFHTLARVWEA